MTRPINWKKKTENRFSVSVVTVESVQISDIFRSGLLIKDMFSLWTFIRKKNCSVNKTLYLYLKLWLLDLYLIKTFSMYSTLFQFTWVSYCRVIIPTESVEIMCRWTYIYTLRFFYQILPHHQIFWCAKILMAEFCWSTKILLCFRDLHVNRLEFNSNRS